MPVQRIDVNSVSTTLIKLNDIGRNRAREIAWTRNLINLDKLSIRKMSTNACLFIILNVAQCIFCDIKYYSSARIN